MNRRMMQCGAMIAIILLTACARPALVKRCTDPQDNAAHHFLQAMESLEAERLEEARTKLDRAIFCDETYPPVYAGHALLLAMQGYPLKAGHAVASITYREGLMALPRPGQVIDLR